MKTLRLFAPPLAALFLAGCASVAMKGTPFYTGEYSVRRGPAEERVNVWPLLYYRAPALSILWPLGEKTEDHFAIRPLMSVYGLDEDEPVVNVLWPLCQFDLQHDRNRVFPFFWGEDYVCGFPLYWHKAGMGSAQGGLDALLPLWWYSRDTTGYDLWLAGPLAHRRDRGDEHGWHLLPFGGHYVDGADDYRFALWPLCHRWSEDDGATSGSAVLPLYYHSRDSDGSRFLSLPYSAGRRAAGDDAWSLLLPLYYARRTPDSRVVATLLGGYRADETGSLFVSLPWSSREGPERDWQLVPPLYYHTRATNREAWFTPLYSRGFRDEGSTDWSALVPLYYRETGPTERLTATLLGGYRTGPDGQRWLIYPLLSWGRTTDDGSERWIVAPLYHSRTQGDEVVERHLFPLFYSSRDPNVFLSLLAGRWRNGAGGDSTLIPPLLTYVSSAPDDLDVWTLGGLAHFSRGPNARPNHVFPLYYRDARSDTFLSLLYSRWKSEETTHVLVPPLLSEYRTDGARRELDILLGLAGERWGGGVEREGHAIPLYYHRGDDALYTPLFGWNRDARDGFFYPLTPLLGFWNGENSGGWLFPLFSRRENRQSQRYGGNVLWSFYDGDERRSHAWMFPFFSYHNDGPVADARQPEALPGTYGRRFWCLPFCWYRNQARVQTSGAGLDMKEVVRMQDAPPERPATVRLDRRHGCFPLWSYEATAVPETGRREKHARLLLLLYDYDREIGPQSESSASETDYTRSRILWRVWHYERSGSDVSVDIFPAITYDRKGDTYKQTSFLWRLFRYERSETGRKLDLFFIPIVRKLSA